MVLACLLCVWLIRMSRDRSSLTDVQLSHTPNQIQATKNAALYTDSILGVNKFLLCPVTSNKPSPTFVIDKRRPATVHARSS